MEGFMLFSDDDDVINWLKSARFPPTLAAQA